MKLLAGLCTVALILAVGDAARAQPPKAEKNTGDISMGSIEDLNQPGIGPELIGGLPAKSEDWPASFYSSSAGSRCTATLVGPTALILAAHCVGNGNKATIKVRDVTYSGTCTHSVKYQTDDSADYALCKMSRVGGGGGPIPDIQLETVNRDPTRIKKEAKLVLTGYGCTQPPATPGGQPSGGNDGIYRTGEAEVIALPGDGEPNTILTRDAVAVCPGDSGGGAFWKSTSGRRLIVSVNSRVWYEKREVYLSSLSSPDGSAFLKEWTDKHPDDKICGVNLKSDRCR